MRTANYTIPVHTISEANTRSHWAARYRRSKEQGGITRMIVQPVPGRPVSVLMTRVGPPSMKNMDSDNLARAMKAVRDGIAESLGVDDGDPSIDWRYDQRRGSRNDYAVDVAIEYEEAVARD